MYICYFSLLFFNIFYIILIIIASLFIYFIYIDLTVNHVMTFKNYMLIVLNWYMTQKIVLLG